jgi:hypothetical protein
MLQIHPTWWTMNAVVTDRWAGSVVHMLAINSDAEADQHQDDLVISLYNMF